jgi:hypothetical protein
MNLRLSQHPGESSLFRLPIVPYRYNEGDSYAAEWGEAKAKAKRADEVIASVPAIFSPLCAVANDDLVAPKLVIEKN